MFVAPLLGILKTGWFKLTDFNRSEGQGGGDWCCNERVRKAVIRLDIVITKHTPLLKVQTYRGFSFLLLVAQKAELLSGDICVKDIPWQAYRKDSKSAHLVTSSKILTTKSSDTEMVYFH